MGVQKSAGAAIPQFQPVIVKFVKDSFFVVEGKADTNRFYIIQSGTVRVSREVDKITGEKESIAGPGDIIAAVSVLAGYSFIETAVAMTDVTMVAVDKNNYSSLIRVKNPIAIRIIQQFSHRLRALNEVLSLLAVSAVAVSEPAHLFNVGEYYARQRKYDQALYAYRRYIAYCPQASNIAEVKQRAAQFMSKVKAAKPTYSSNKMERTCPANSLLFAEGEPGNELYIIQEGSVKIVKIVKNQEVVLAVLRKGDIFGEMALLENKPRTASAEIMEDCKVLAVNRANFTELIKTSPELVARLTTLMAERIWLMYRQLTNAMIESPLGRVYDALAIHLEKERVSFDANQPYLFDFGFKELAEMARIPQKEHNGLIEKLIATKRVNIVNNRVFISDPVEILRQAGFSRRAL